MGTILNQSTINAFPILTTKQAPRAVNTLDLSTFQIPVVKDTIGKIRHIGEDE